MGFGSLKIRLAILIVMLMGSMGFWWRNHRCQAWCVTEAR